MFTDWLCWYVFTHELKLWPTFVFIYFSFMMTWGQSNILWSIHLRVHIDARWHNTRLTGNLPQSQSANCEPYIDHWTSPDHVKTIAPQLTCSEMCSRPEVWLGVNQWTRGSQSLRLLTDSLHTRMWRDWCSSLWHRKKKKLLTIFDSLSNFSPHSFWS